MAHSDPVIASIQSRAVSGPKVIPLAIHPPDAQALVAKIKFLDPALQRRITYAAQHSISVALTEDEMKALIIDINRST